MPEDLIEGRELSAQDLSSVLRSFAEHDEVHQSEGQRLDVQLGAWVIDPALDRLRHVEPAMLRGVQATLMYLKHLVRVGSQREVEIITLQRRHNGAPWKMIHTEIVPSRAHCKFTARH